MNRPSKSILIFGTYSLIMGAVLLFVPDLVLPLAGLPSSNEAWIYILGFVLMCSSYYYIRAALSGNLDFARYTTHTRLAAPLLVAFLIITGKADYHFLSFGIIDGVGGVWTLVELNKFKSSL
ncbi:MAG: hypothetical protein K0S12_391 [Bacteroidetes bacterium]|jgi:hypothetical protein|nr:hypothetical protein [Bacteroidota bacterium]